MAKVDIGQLSPDAVPRVRGRFLIRPWRGQWIAQAWPKKRGANQHPNSVWTSQQWAYAARWSANMDSLQLQTAQAMTAGTDWMPRDLLIRAMYGKAYEIGDPSGQVWTVNPHSPPPPRRPPVLAWQFNRFDDDYAATSSSSAAAFKGSIFTSQLQGDIEAALAIFTPVNNGQYKMVLAALNASNVIQSIVASTIITISGTVQRYREFDLAASLAVGTRYWLAIGRTNGASNYVLPVSTASNPKWKVPIDNVGLGTLAQTAPAVGHTVTLGSQVSPPMGMLLNY